MPPHPCQSNPTTSPAPPAPRRTSWEAEASDGRLVACHTQTPLPWGAGSVSSSWHLSFVWAEAPQLPSGTGKLPGPVEGGTGQVGALLGLSVLLRGAGGKSGIYGLGTWTPGTQAELRCGQVQGAGRGTHLAGPWIECELACPRSPSSSAGRNDSDVSGKTGLPGWPAKSPLQLCWAGRVCDIEGPEATGRAGKAGDQEQCASLGSPSPVPALPPSLTPHPCSLAPEQGTHHRCGPHRAPEPWGLT